VRDASGIEVEVGQVLDGRPLSHLQWGVIVLCGLVVLLDGYDIQAMALAAPSIASEWSLPPSVFGIALASALMGLMLGAGVLAPLGDRWGRRPLLIGGMALVGFASLGTAFSTDLSDLVLWRLLTGLGLGASIPNATALTSEYMPTRRRAALVTLMFCNMSVGAFAAGFIAPSIIKAWGWEGIFILGGAIPFLICLLLFLAAPESVRLLLARSPNDPRITRLMARLAPDIDPATVRSDADPTLKHQSVAILFALEYRARTALIWCAFALNLFVLYVLISWIPTLLRGAGWLAPNALRGVGVINAGGVVGGLLLSWFVDRGKMVRAMLTAYAGTAVAMLLFAVLPSGSTWWFLLLVIGGGTAGAQMTLNALAAALYPQAIRATGLGWATGIGRIGAILGPLLGGVMMAQHLEPTAVLSLLVAPVAVCGLVVSLLPRVAPSLTIERQSLVDIRTGASAPERDPERKG
jgi:MFS transporter, AAHS family, 4-hydroxybenzoate transporter